MGKSKLSVEQILEMRREGKTLSEIATQAGLSRQGITKIIKRHDVVPGSPPVSEEALAADVRMRVLRQFTDKKIKGMDARQQAIVLKTLHPRKRGRVDKQEIKDFLASLKDVDLEPYRTTRCYECGLPQACRKYPICKMCLPDESFTNPEPVQCGDDPRIKVHATFRQIKCKTEGCMNRTTSPWSGRGEQMGRDQLCNSCRKKNPSILTDWLTSQGWVLQGKRWVKEVPTNERGYEAFRPFGD